MGWRVIAVDAFTDYYDPAIKRTNAEGFAGDPACTLIKGDLRELDLEGLLAEVSVVFHLAAQPGVRASWDEFDLYTRHNLKATQQLLAAAARTPVERLVIASSSSIYGDAEELPTREDLIPRPVAPYGVTKLATEHLAQIYWRSHGVPAVLLRYFTVYGPRQRPDMAFNRLIGCALAEESVAVFGDGEQTRDFTFVSDAVTATCSAARRGTPGRVYNIGGGSRVSVNEVLAIIGRLVGRSLDVRHESNQKGDMRDTYADTSLARRDLAYAPAVTLEEGLAAELGWLAAMIASR